MIVLDTHIWHWWINQIEHHKDPQDRIIIATALHHNASLLSFDAAFSVYRELDGHLIQAK